MTNVTITNISNTTLTLNLKKCWLLNNDLIKLVNTIGIGPQIPYVIF